MTLCIKGPNRVSPLKSLNPTSWHIGSLHSISQSWSTKASLLKKLKLPCQGTWAHYYHFLKLLKFSPGHQKFSPEVLVRVSELRVTSLPVFFVWRHHCRSWWCKAPFEPQSHESRFESRKILLPTIAFCRNQFGRMIFHLRFVGIFVDACQCHLHFDYFVKIKKLKFWMSLNCHLQRHKI